MANNSIELALSVLETEKANLSEDQLKRLAELTNTGADVRSDVTETLETEGRQPVADTEDAEKPELSPEEQEELLSALEARLTSEPKHYKRPKGVNFAEVRTALEARPDLMRSLAQMENTGVVDIRAIEGNEFVFCDFAKETDESRRNLTYSQAAAAAKAMGVDIQSEEGWCALQKLGAFDTDSWIWVKSDDIIDTGRARFAYRRGDRLGVSRDYADRHSPRGGWRASLRVPKA